MLMVAGQASMKRRWHQVTQRHKARLVEGPGASKQRQERATHRVLLQLGLLPPFCQLLGYRLWRLPGKAASSFSSHGHQARTPHSPGQLTPMGVAGSRGSGHTPAPTASLPWDPQDKPGNACQKF